MSITSSFPSENCQARVLVLVIVLDYSLRLVSIPVSKDPEAIITETPTHHHRKLFKDHVLDYSLRLVSIPVSKDQS